MERITNRMIIKQTKTFGLLFIFDLINVGSTYDIYVLTEDEFDIMINSVDLQGYENSKCYNTNNNNIIFAFCLIITVTIYVLFTLNNFILKPN